MRISDMAMQVFIGDVGDHVAYAAFENWRSLPIQTWLGGSASTSQIPSRVLIQCNMLRRTVFCLVCPQ